MNLFAEELPSKPITLPMYRLPDNHRICDSVEAVLASGYAVREGGPEPKQRPLHPLWKREPPETP
jgi:hypothetical protein